MLVLAALYNLSDEALEFQVRDRLSFMRFLGLELHHPVPDATTIWLFREALVKADWMRLRAMTQLPNQKNRSN
jgi:IS5 family transposase